MKKVFLLIFFMTLLVSAEWADCPFSETDCTGECGRFIDTDGDGICDHSQLPPEERELVSAEVPLATPTLYQGQIPAALGGSLLGERYPFLALITIISMIYFLTWKLSKDRRIKRADHIMFWNILLLLSFLISGLLGIFLILRINYGIVIPFPSMLLLHVEAGIVMFLISLFHIGWHLGYFRSVFRL